MGNTDKFTTEQLEERLAKKGVIDYDGPPPASAAMGNIETSNKSNKDGKAVYESARARFMAEMDEEDPFASDNDNDTNTNSHNNSDTTNNNNSSSSSENNTGSATKGVTPSSGAITGASTTYGDGSVKFY